MNRQTPQNNYPSETQSPISTPVSRRFNQNSQINAFGRGSLNQMENIPMQSKPVQEKSMHIAQKQHNTMYMSSIESSVNRNQRHQPSNGILQPMNPFNGQRQDFNVENNIHEPQPFQQGMQLGYHDKNTPLGANQNQINVQYQKKSTEILNSVEKAPFSGLISDRIQQEQHRSQKKIEIDSIRKQLEDINNNMIRLGLTSETESKTQPHQTKISSSKHPMANESPKYQNKEIIRSMIMNGQKNQLPSNHHHQLSLEKTYQQAKSKQAGHIKIPKSPQSCSKLPSPNLMFIGSKEEAKKEMLKFGGKQRRGNKSKTELQFSETRLSLVLPDNSQKNNLVSNFSSILPQKELKNLISPMKLSNQISIPPFILEERTANLSPQNIQFDSSKPKFRKDDLKQFPIPHFSPKVQAEQKPSLNFQINEPVITPPSSYSQQSSSIPKGPNPKGFLKKKVQPECDLATVPFGISSILKIQSNEQITLFGEPDKIKKSDFQIGKKMGKGQFGEVELVRHQKTGFICGLKTMSKKQIRDEKYEGQIARELSIQFYLTHRNITPLYGYFEDQDNVYLLVQFCPDGHLLGMLKKVRRMEEEDVSPIIKQICEGADYIHKEMIIHRDIKPENVLFSHGVAKIVDFGWAVYRGLGLRKTVSGSPLYYSPEIVLGTEYDEKVDVWDIGMMTYECLLGKVPFKVYTEMDLKRIVSDQVTFPSYVDVTDQAQDFILKILQKKPEDRMTIREALMHPFITKYEDKKQPIEVTRDINSVLN